MDKQPKQERTSTEDLMRHFGEAAREALAGRLHDGKTVGGLVLRDLIDTDLNGSRAEFAVIEITNLLLADSGERAARADLYVEGVIERYLENCEDLVQAFAEEWADEERDDQ